MSEPRTALIAGAGIGGLAAALALKRIGWQVEVHERAAQARELGFALLLAPNAMRALKQLGVDGAVRAAAWMPRFGELRQPDGTVLKRFDTAPIEAALGEPTVVALRPVLHGALLEAVGPDTVKLGRPVTEVSEQSATVVVGADGVDSVVRKALHPNEPPPRDSGLYALRGVAVGVAHLLGEGISGAQYLGRGIEAGLARASETTVYWYLSLLAGDVDPAVAPLELLDRSTRGFHDEFRKLVLATKPEDLRLDKLRQRDPLEHWGRGNVTLLGDAAHPMLPHAGQGAAQALEDAVALGRDLENADDVPAALRRYEQVRRERTTRVVHIAARNASMSRVRNAFACWLRDSALRMIPTGQLLKQMVAIGHPPEP